MQYSWPEEKPYPKDMFRKFRYAMEIELTERPLANLIRFFDFSELDKVRADLKNEYFKDYVINTKEAFEDLPFELKAELTKGLTNLDVKIANQTQEGIDKLKKAPKIIQEVNPQTNQSSNIIVSNQDTPTAAPDGIILSEEAKSNIEKKILDKKGSSLNAQTVSENWKTINERWNALPKERKAKAFKWEHLGNKTKAKLFIDYQGMLDPRDEDAPKIKLKKDFLSIAGVNSKKEAQKIKALFQRLNFFRDLGALEFNYKDSFIQLNPQAYIDDINLLTQLAGVQDQLKDPKKERMDISYHFNISIQGEEPSREKAKLLNDYWFARMINNGQEHAATASEGHVTFEGRQFVGVNENRYEIRAHIDDPTEELKQMTTLLKLSPETLELVVTQEVEKAHAKMASNFSDLEGKGGEIFKRQFMLRYPNKDLFTKLVQHLKTKGSVIAFNELSHMQQINPDQFKEFDPILKKELGFDADTIVQYDVHKRNFDKLTIKQYYIKINELAPKLEIGDIPTLIKHTDISGILAFPDLMYKKNEEFRRAFVLNAFKQKKYYLYKDEPLLRHPAVYNDPKIIEALEYYPIKKARNLEYLGRMLVNGNDIPAVTQAIRKNLKTHLKKFSFSNPIKSEEISYFRNFIQQLEAAKVELDFDTIDKFNFQLKSVFNSLKETNLKLPPKTYMEILQILERSQENVSQKSLVSILNTIDFHRERPQAIEFIFKENRELTPMRKAMLFSTTSTFFQKPDNISSFLSYPVSANTEIEKHLKQNLELALKEFHQSGAAPRINVYDIRTSPNERVFHLLDTVKDYKSYPYVALKKEILPWLAYRISTPEELLKFEQHVRSLSLRDQAWVISLVEDANRGRPSKIAEIFTRLKNICGPGDIIKEMTGS